MLHWYSWNHTTRGITDVSESKINYTGRKTDENGTEMFDFYDFYPLESFLWKVTLRLIKIIQSVIPNLKNLNYIMHYEKPGATYIKTRLLNEEFSQNWSNKSEVMEYWKNVEEIE